MAKWEYTIRTTTGEDMDEDMEMMNELGAEGWELVQVVNTEVFVDADNGQEEGQDSEVVEVLFNYFFKRSID
ncbi:MAG: DUF4177 domain-containing protein [Armatimonadaceae bacterium]|jgi:hypothetical protein